MSASYPERDVARFFFNLRRGQASQPKPVVDDVEGDEIASVALARLHALDAARRLMRQRSHSIRDWLDCSFEITDEAGCIVMTVPFGAIVPDQPFTPLP